MKGWRKGIGKKKNDLLIAVSQAYHNLTNYADNNTKELQQRITVTYYRSVIVGTLNINNYNLTDRADAEGNDFLTANSSFPTLEKESGRRDFRQGIHVDAETILSSFHHLEDQFLMLALGNTGNHIRIRGKSRASRGNIMGKSIVKPGNITGKAFYTINDKS